jgi:hypothetical protein
VIQAQRTLGLEDYANAMTLYIERVKKYQDAEVRPKKRQRDQLYLQHKLRKDTDENEEPPISSSVLSDDEDGGSDPY